MVFHEKTTISQNQNHSAIHGNVPVSMKLSSGKISQVYTASAEEITHSHSIINRLVVRTLPCDMGDPVSRLWSESDRAKVDLFLPQSWPDQIVSLRWVSVVLIIYFFLDLRKLHQNWYIPMNSFD